MERGYTTPAKKRGGELLKGDAMARTVRPDRPDPFDIEESHLGVNSLLNNMPIVRKLPLQKRRFMFWYFLSSYWNRGCVLVSHSS